MALSDRNYLYDHRVTNAESWRPTGAWSLA